MAAMFSFGHMTGENREYPEQFYFHTGLVLLHHVVVSHAQYYGNE